VIDFIQAVIGPKKCPWCRSIDVETGWDRFLESKLFDRIFKIPGVGRSIIWYWCVSKWPGLPWHKHFHERPSGAADSPEMGDPE
jgi:hypothetical protein